MSATGEITLAFGDARHVFNVQKIGQALELQDKCGAGIGTIYSRLRAGGFYVNDIRETIRLGLIGGGLKPVEALLLVERYVDARPWKETQLLAIAILTAAMVGVPQEEDGATPKKDAAERAATEPAPTTAGLSAPSSTAPAPPSALPRETSIG